VSSRKPTESIPAALSIRDALQSSQPLTRLRAALLDSRARFVAIEAALPKALAHQVQPGPVDAEGWSLLARNAAVAAKLRQLTPRFETLLREAGWVPSTVRIKVLAEPPR
jgi:hypothetical protein